jgi:hypothetical protein
VESLLDMLAGVLLRAALLLLLSTAIQAFLMRRLAPEQHASALRRLRGNPDGSPDASTDDDDVLPASLASERHCCQHCHLNATLQAFGPTDIHANLSLFNQTHANCLKQGHEQQMNGYVHAGDTPDTSLSQWRLHNCLELFNPGFTRLNRVRCHTLTLGVSAMVICSSITAVAHGLAAAAAAAAAAAGPSLGGPTTPCRDGFHNCSGTCANNFNVNTCGKRCKPCPIPLNGVSR